MKFIGFCLRGNNKSGIILIVVLWILVILSVLAIGLGRSARIDLAITKHRIGKLKADFLTWAAVNYAMNQIRISGEGQAPSGNTLYQCGFDLRDGKTSQDIFKKVHLKDGSFDISYIVKQDNGQGQACYGFQDEERRINITGIHQGNYKVLTNLFTLLNIEEEKAEALAAQIADWQDTDSEKTNPPYGAEKDDYLSLPKPYPCKDGPFESLEELLLIKEMTPDIFLKIKDYLTVFPQNNMLSINVNTAPRVVLKALFRFMVQESPGVEIADADSLAEKIISFRKGEDALACTADDRAINNTNIGSLGLNANENALYLTAVGNYLKDTSDYFRVCAKGIDSQYAVSSDVEAVISKENLSIMFWRRK